MRLTAQKRLAGQILKRSPKKIKLDSTRLEDIKESITKADIRALIVDNAITGKPVKKASRGRTRKVKKQKAKGRRKGAGLRKGKKTARLPRKLAWMNKVRKQRIFLKELKEKELINQKSYRELYRKSKGGLFRSKEHMKLFINEKGYIIKK